MVGATCTWRAVWPFLHAGLRPAEEWEEEFPELPKLQVGIVGCARRPAGARALACGAGPGPGPGCREPRPPRRLMIDDWAIDDGEASVCFRTSLFFPRR